MSEPRLIFDSEFPEALESEVASLLAPWLWLARDLQSIRISLKGSAPDSPEGEAAILVLRAYHVAHLWLDPSFWSLAFEEKELILVHEMFHVATCRLSRELEHVIEEFVPPKRREKVRERLTDAEEELVDRLAWDFRRALTSDGGRR